MMRILKIVGGVLATLFVLTCVGLDEPVFFLLFGWIAFPIHVLPQMTFEPVAIGVAAVSLVMMIVLAHGLARWLFSSSPHTGPLPEGKETPRPWRLRWTVTVVAIVLLLFVSGISIIVSIHQTIWLVTSKQPLMEGGFRVAARRMFSQTLLRQIGLAFHNYAQANHVFPPGGTFTSDGEMRHSWETMLLPYMEGNDIKPNLNLPWNHPDNAQYFKVALPAFLNPGFRSEHRVDEQGYGLSHYAVNSRVLGPNRAMRPKDVTDGLSNTIFAGEVADHFQPWGHPINWRDPALGINTSPDGFGAPWPGGAQFLFMDGSVRFLSNTIDPAVLKALGTPNGGEKIPEGDW